MTTLRDIHCPSNAAVAERPIVVTEQDRRRLEAVIRDAVATASQRRDYLVALQAELDRAAVVDPADVPPDAVTMNSTVRVRDLQTGEVDTYHLVYPDFSDMSQNRLSVLAPIGTAILGHRVGDVVEWQVPSGEVLLLIEAIDYQPESQGRFDL